MLTRITIALWLLIAFIGGAAADDYLNRHHHVAKLKQPVKQQVPNAAAKYRQEQIEIIAAAIPASALNYGRKK